MEVEALGTLLGVGLAVRTFDIATAVRRVSEEAGGFWTGEARAHLQSCVGVKMIVTIFTFTIPSTRDKRVVQAAAQIRSVETCNLCRG